MSRSRGVDRSIPRPIPTLGELIAQRRNELRLSYKAMADLAQAAGFQITEAAFQRLVNEQPRSLPQPDTLRVLSIVLQLPIHDVVDAACRSVSLYDETDTGRRVAAVVAEHARGLSAAQVDQVLEVLVPLVRMVRQTGTADQAGAT